MFDYPLFEILKELLLGSIHGLVWFKKVSNFIECSFDSNDKHFDLFHINIQMINILNIYLFGYISN